MRVVRFWLQGDRTIDPIAAAHHDLSVGYVSFAIPKRKKLVGSEFAAL
jgi:hypothetical protein